MNSSGDTILAIASEETIAAVSSAVSDLEGIRVTHADSAAQAIETVFKTPPAFIVMEPDMAGLDPAELAAGLARQDQAHTLPLLLVTDSPEPPDLLGDFPALLADHMTRPLSPPLLKAKTTLFLELYRHRTAVSQSIDELDRVYAQFMDHHTSTMSETNLKKDLRAYAAAAANQVNPLLNNIRAGTYMLQRAPDLPGRLKSGVAQIRNNALQIQRVIRYTRRTRHQWAEGIDLPLDASGRKRRCRVLYAVGSDDEFRIIQHTLASQIRVDLVQAHTIGAAMEAVAELRPDILFIDHKLATAGGLELLEEFNRLRTEIPAIFLVDTPNARMGAEALTRGAHTFLIKEEITGHNLVYVIRETLDRARLTREIQGARDRITLISRRDRLTRLYNRRCFDQALNTELSKSKRYEFPLSILLADVDGFKAINDDHGYETGDLLLTACAARIQSMVRTLDVVCRYGGEEFGIVLPNTGLEGARILAQRIREDFSQNQFEASGSPFNLTVSIGIAAFTGQTGEGRDDGPMDSDMVKQALDALDRASARGGDQVHWITI